MKTHGGAFIVCDACGYCCYVRGFMATSVGDQPPCCPGCRTTTRIARHAPWRDAPGRVAC